MLAKVVLTLIVLAAAPAGGPTAPRPRGSEALEWLQGYLRIDTTNPPGNEERAASYLAELLHREGLATRLMVSPDRRASLYSRLSGGPDARGAVVLLHHMDVVPAAPGWEGDPFSGELRDGRIWGRGAIDDKSLGIAHLAAFIDLTRHPARLRHDVVFLAVADEERGGRQGSAWLLQDHPELFADVVAVLGEGGSNRLAAGRLRWWGVEVAQKRPLWLRARTSGRPGHGSTLNLHTAPHRLVRALDRLLERPLDWRLTEEARTYFAAVAPLEAPRFRQIIDDLDGILDRSHPERHLLPGLPNYLLDTVQVNVLRAGSDLNAAPGEAEAMVDIRLLPNTDEDAFLAEVKELLGPEVQVEVLLRAPPVPASATTEPFFSCLEEFLGRRAPVVPTFIPGITDARYFRARDIAAYGLSPFPLDGADLRGIHGPDERIPLKPFLAGVETMKELLRACVCLPD